MMAVVMYFSLHAVGFAAGPSLAFALVPLLLGMLDVMAPVAYAMTAVALILACTAALFQIHDLKRETTEFLSSAFHEVQESAGPAKGKPQSGRPGK